MMHGQRDWAPPPSARNRDTSRRSTPICLAHSVESCGPRRGTRPGRTVRARTCTWGVAVAQTGQLEVGSRGTRASAGVAGYSRRVPEKVRRRDDHAFFFTLIPAAPAGPPAERDEGRDVLRAEAEAAARRRVGALGLGAHVLLVVRDDTLADGGERVLLERDQAAVFLARARGVHPGVVRALELWEELLGAVDFLSVRTRGA